MSGINKVILIGNLGKDPEVRHTQGGDPVVSFTLATGETWKDKDSGERKERTEWHRVVIFNDRLGEIAEKYLRKGSRVYLEGGLQTRKWTDQSGQEKYTTEVVLARYRGELTLLGDANGSERERGPRETPRSAPRQGAANGGRGGAPSWEPDRGGGDLDDSIPFGPAWQ